MFFNRQEKNYAKGSIAGRDIITTNSITQHAGEKTHISRLFDQLKSETQNQPTQSREEFIEELQHFMSRAATEMSRSLAEKLADSGRIDIKMTAEESKERAAKKIIKFQSSKAAQEIFAYILGQIHSKYVLRIRPLIAVGAPRPEIDAAIDLNVITPLVNSLEPSPLGLTPDMILAMLYYLAGNCYIQWD